MPPALREPRRLSPRRAWGAFVGWCGGKHPVARTLGALLAAAIPVVSILLALGVIQPSATTEDALAASQAKTLEAGSSKMRIDVRTAGRTPVRYVATGTFDFREERGTFSYNLTRMPGLAAAAAVEARFFQNVAYLHLPAPVEPGKPWLLVDLEEDPPLIDRLAERSGRASPAVAAVPAVRVHDPTAILAALDRAGDVEDLGEVTEFGLDVHKYRGTLTSAAGGAGRVVATAWIDSGHLVRRLQLSDASGGATTMSFYDFGTEVTTRPPPPARVTVLGDRLREQLLAG